MGSLSITNLNFKDPEGKPSENITGEKRENASYHHSLTFLTIFATVPSANLYF